MNRKRKPVVETPPSLSSEPVSSPSSAPDIAFSVTPCSSNNFQSTSGPVSSPSSAPDIAFSVMPCSSNNFQSTSAKKLKSVVPYISTSGESLSLDKC